MPTILVVDDSPLELRKVEALLRKNPDYHLKLASDGDEAVTLLESCAPELVITDLVMPGMNGLQLLSRIVTQQPMIPVVLMTADGSEAIAAQAVQAGALGYVPKGILPTLLPAVVERLLRLARERRDQDRLHRSIAKTEVTFVLDNNDSSLVTPLLEYVNGSVARSGIVPPGNEELICLALEEALRNAIHHGNLELGSELREAEDEQEFQRVIEQRRRLPPYKDRKVQVEISISQDGARFLVRDEGPGFDPSKLPDPRDPDRINNVCGRGVLLMRALMDDVTYNETGNQVVLVKHPLPSLADES